MPVMGPYQARRRLVLRWSHSGPQEPFTASSELVWMLYRLSFFLWSGRCIVFQTFFGLDALSSSRLSSHHLSDFLFLTQVGKRIKPHFVHPFNYSSFTVASWQNVLTSPRRATNGLALEEIL